jgi:AAA15 family ATPase/GTPase
MTESFEVKNFRCFESLKLTNLKTVNVITGYNASGKSALLEAFVAGGRATPAGF